MLLHLRRQPRLQTALRSVGEARSLALHSNLPEIGFALPLLLSHSPSVCLQGLSFQLIGCDYKHAVGFRISYIYYSQVSSRIRLTNSDSRTIRPRSVFATICQDLLYFALINVVIVNVRLTRTGV